MINIRTFDILYEFLLHFDDYVRKEVNNLGEASIR